ncbi:DUF4145 domain-containing protein [Bradyrhizobium sp. S69]|uniref:DUF4145 domain-containing protein n=1 Tax=Bradyrhizobium sp. S69 TaxID=1641856 RepID=UPI00131E5663|nr:DUF4145 domain-containing protein [Bradyrhizobium sp. S69]
MAEEERIVMAPCSDCVGKRKHKILFETAQYEEETVEKYAMIECCGCGRISMGYQRVWKYDGSVDNDYFPSPVSRKEPNWVYWVWLGQFRASDEKEAAKLMFLLREIYRAVHGGQYRLAAMGIRALLEQVMIMKVGDLPTFNDKLDAFQRDGYISAIQRGSMRATLDVGDAAMHRGFVPTEQDLNVALDVVEGVMAPIFGHANEAEALAKRVPPRKP